IGRGQLFFTDKSVFLFRRQFYLKYHALVHFVISVPVTGPPGRWNAGLCKKNNKYKLNGRDQHGFFYMCFKKHVVKHLWGKVRKGRQFALPNVINGGKIVMHKSRDYRDFALRPHDWDMKSTHFLYTSANTISALVIQEKPNEKSARDSIQKKGCNLF